MQKEFEPSSAANAARIGRKRRQEAAVSERRRLEGADRRSARERPVQVRELALYICNPRQNGSGFFFAKNLNRVAQRTIVCCLCLTCCFLYNFFMKEILLLFFTVALTDFFAEMGDKTQFMLIGMTSKYKLRDIIPGTLAAIVVLNGIAVFAGGIISVFVPDWLIKFVASAAFFYFGITAILKNEEDDEEAESGKFKIAVAAVFCTFFIAELGDKTQLTAITFGANGGIGRAFVIWAACVVGFFAADMIGMLAGLFLKKKMPEGFLNAVSFVLFSFFGFTTLWEGLGILQDSLAASPDGNGVHKKLIFGLASVIFAFLSIGALVKKLKNRKKNP